MLKRSDPQPSTSSPSVSWSASVSWIFCILLWVWFLSISFSHTAGSLIFSMAAAQRSKVTIDTWQRKLFLPVGRLNCFLINSVDNNNATILRCDKDLCSDSSRCLVTFFSGKLGTVYVLCKHAHIKKCSHFVTFKPIWRGACDHVSTVGGSAFPTGKGTVKWAWQDIYHSVTKLLLLPQLVCLYFVTNSAWSASWQFLLQHQHWFQDFFFHFILERRTIATNHPAQVFHALSRDQQRALNVWIIPL